MQHEFITTCDAARILNVSPDTIRRWAKVGRLPAIRTASGIRLFERSVIAQLSAKTEAQG
jgi:excisionase family DNA binding protein